MQNPISRRAFTSLLLGASAATALAPMAAAQSPGGLLDSLLPTSAPPRLWIGLADISTSTGADTLELYRTTLTGFFKQIKTGDSALIGAIADQGLAEMPRFISLETNSNSLKQKAIEKKARTEIAAEINALLSRKKANESRLLETLASLAPHISRARTANMPVTVCMCTDGFEYSSYGDFSKPGFGPKESDAILNRIAHNRQFMTDAAPSRPSVDLMIIGVGDKNPNRAAIVKAFWEKYTTQCGVTLSYYARSAPQFS